MNLKAIVAALLALLIFVVPVHAAQLGVNYYHESLMNPWSAGPYIKRSLSEVGQDFDNIKQISNAVKLYMNPFVGGNLEWNEQVAGVAKAKGMHVAVNMMVDDRHLTDSNWQEYADKVAGACSALDGKVDTILVGNEITLHSPLSRTDIRDRVISLMDRCDQSFSGEVSYEEFWYAKDVWKGTGRKIYFMQYEGLDSFRSNVAEMERHFGSNGAIGEWGEDQLEDHVRYDEQWQKDQIRQRWEIIQGTSTPIAYIFTYREPSEEAFGIIRGDGSRRPLWEVFGAPTSAPAPVQQPAPAEEPAPAEQPVVVEAPVVTPAPETTPTPSPLLERLPLTCAAQEECLTTSMGWDGACRQVTFTTSGQPVDLLACYKGDGVTEVHMLNTPSVPVTACLGKLCVSDDSKFAQGALR